MKPRSALLLLLLFLGAAVAVARDDGITWLAEYDGKALPTVQGWSPFGGLAGGARVVDGALRLVDDSVTEDGGFRMTWTPDPSREIVVEARVRVESMATSRGGTSMWPVVDGAPVGLLVSDGRQQGGLVFRPEKIATWVDRVAVLNTKREFHTFRLVIRGSDMSVEVDGVQKIRGEGAFAKPADSPAAFIAFGSNSKEHKGEAFWSSVRLGLRKPVTAPLPPRLRITVGKPWDIPSPDPKVRITRPFVHNLGQSLLLMSVAQGPDAIMEPYGAFKSTDEGKTWSAIAGLQVKSFAPQSFVRLPDGGILGVSRWTVKYNREPGVYIGMSYRFDARAERYTMFESLIRVPEDTGEWMAFSRDLIDMGNGVLLASVYAAATPGGRRAMLLKSVDGGATWTHHATLGPRPEPSVVRFSGNDMMAILRITGWMPFEQIWSQDGGKTWTPPVVLEEGSVDPDMVNMSNGVVACSYGRPGSNLMFSVDRGKTWRHHQVIAYERGFNYTAIREVRPGRLLFVHDAPRMQALYVDVERLD